MCYRTKNIFSAEGKVNYALRIANYALKETEIKMTELIKLTLSNGMNVEMDTTKANGHLLMQCRNATNNGVSTVIYLISEIATFDGKKLPAPEILNFSAVDVVKLENAWGEGFQG